MFLRRNLVTLQLCSTANIHNGHSRSNKKSFYDVLEITPKATKNDIKKSYYRLSLIYHPDQNKGDKEASIKFREITEAYEILGDIMKRRMYDKGLYDLGTSSDSKADPEIYSKSYKVSKKAPSVGRTQIYDFDSWTRFHYQTNLHRKQYDKKTEERREQYNKAEKSRSGSIYFIMITIIFFAFLSSIIEERDKDPRKRR